MDISSIKLIYFSPTRTTRKVLEVVAQGFGAASTEHMDLTPPDVVTTGLTGADGELAVIGAPVYSGRVPADAASRLRRLEGKGTPAVVVVVYGNRAYEDALMELRDLALEAGFRPVAAGAFIGEHSFSNSATPIAPGRPDADDLRKAVEFGRMVLKKIKDVAEVGEMSPLNVPGSFPYKDRRVLPVISPVTQASVCARCGLCASVCPTAAITVGEIVATDRALCIKCCACVKACSTGARVMEDPFIRQVSEQLSVNCGGRKEPETYF